MYKYVVNFDATLLRKMNFDWKLISDRRLSACNIYDMCHKRLKSELALIPKNLTINKLKEYRYEETVTR